MLLDVCKSNSQGEHAVLLLTCPVLLPRAPGDLLLLGLHAKGLQTGKKHLMPHMQYLCLQYCA